MGVPDLDKVTASLIAVRTLVYALIETHPNPTALLAAFRSHREIVEEMFVASFASDEQLATAKDEFVVLDKVIQAYIAKPRE